MDCRRARALFSERLDERLADDLAANHESHLRRCEPCRAEWANYELFFASMPNLSETKALGPLVLPNEPPGQADAFRPQLLPSSALSEPGAAGTEERFTQPDEEPRSKWRFLRSPQLKVAAAAALLMGTSHVGAFLLGKGEREALRPQISPSTLVPAPLPEAPAGGAGRELSAAAPLAGISAVANRSSRRSNAETRALVASHMRLLRWILGTAEAASQDAAAARSWLTTSLPLLDAVAFKAAISQGLREYDGWDYALLDRYFRESEQVLELLRCSLRNEPGDSCARMCLVRALQAGDAQLMDVISALRPVLVGAGWSSYWQEEGRSVLDAITYPKGASEANDTLFLGLAHLQRGDLRESMRVTGSLLNDRLRSPGHASAARYLYREALAEASMLCSSTTPRAQPGCSESTMRRLGLWTKHPAWALEPSAAGLTRSIRLRGQSAGYAVPVSGR